RYIMGIKDLSKVIGDHSPSSVKLNDIKNYFGRVVAIDASMSLYQFLIAVRQGGNQLQDESGETTSHLMGMFYRTVRMITNGIKPVYVFDGKPPEMKFEELEKRTERRVEAEKQLAEAKEKGDAMAVEKFERRLVKVTKDQNEEAKRLLRLMGVPVFDAPCEAEAQCAELVRAGKVFAAATEDMDALAFGSKRLLRQLTASEAKKLPVKEINLEQVLKDFEMDMPQFVDLCILLGCDYTKTIRGIGPKKAFELIQKHKTIENVLNNIDTEKYPVPENWQYREARRLFMNPEITNCEDINLQWSKPDTEEIVKYLCGEKNFNEERVRSSLVRMEKGRQSAQQGRIDSFFAVSSNKKSEPTTTKRKAVDEKCKQKDLKKRGASLAKKLKK
uniref:Flap endonuclease 1 n=1 Tax=Parascaris univalens TaxID=6257 RepID=A0A915BLT3_PARUN